MSVPVLNGHAERNGFDSPEPTHQQTNLDDSERPKTPLFSHYASSRSLASDSDTLTSSITTQGPPSRTQSLCSVVEAEIGEPEDIEVSSGRSGTEPEDPVPVGNLIDLTSDEFDEAHPQPPPARSPRMSGEESFEGVANGLGGGSLLDAPLSDLTAHSPAHVRARNIPNASSAAKQLYTQGMAGSGSGYSGGSRRSSFNSDVEAMSVSDAELHSEISDISTQVSKIQKQLAMMEDSHFSSDEKQIRLKSDNAVLQERLNALEEQMLATDERWREKVKEEKQRSKDLTARLEREKALEVESWSLKQQLAEQEAGRMKVESERLQQQLSRAEDEKTSLKEKLEDVEYRLSAAEEEAAAFKRELRDVRNAAGEDSVRTAAELQELRAANEELEYRKRQSSVAERAEDLAAELHRVTEELREQKERNEELSAELLQAHVNAGQSLLSSLGPADGPSLAAEMTGKDNHELLNALKEQEMCNTKLRTYIDGILMRVIEKYPEILEVRGGI